jgi:hypothetical protein
MTIGIEFPLRDVGSTIAWAQVEPHRAKIQRAHGGHWSGWPPMAGSTAETSRRSSARRRFRHRNCRWPLSPVELGGRRKAEADGI